MKNHEYFEELVSLKVDDMLTAEQESELDAHLQECSDCRERLEIFLTIRRLSDELLVDPPEDLTRGVMYRVGLERGGRPFVRRFFPHIFTVAGAAAAIALLIVSGAFKSVFRSDNMLDGWTAAESAAGESAALSVHPETVTRNDSDLKVDEYDRTPEEPQPTPAPEGHAKAAHEKDFDPPRMLGSPGPSSQEREKNMFDLFGSEVGDVVMGFEIVEIDAGDSGKEKNIRIVFAGEATLTGTLYFDNDENAKWGKLIYFYPDSESAANLPLPADDEEETWLGIDNYNEAVKLLDAGPGDENKTIVYDAVIVIDNYTVTRSSSDLRNFATLKSIESLNRISQ